MTDREMLERVAADVMNEAGPASAIDVEDGATRTGLWDTIVELGWPLVGIPEDAGGAGGELNDLVTLLAGTGRYCAAVPLLGTALAYWVLASANQLSGPGDVAAAGPARPDEQLTAERAAGGWRLTGRLTRVPWARDADPLLVFAVDGGRQVVLSVPAGTAGVEVRHGRNVAGEPRDDIALNDVRLPIGAEIAEAPPYERVRERAALLQAAAIVGATEAAYELSREHAQTRQQFGRPLAAFQAVGHQIARMLGSVTMGKHAVSSAVETLATSGSSPVTSDRIAAARVVTGCEATAVARRAHQVHGAMGVTREHRLHLATRRLWSWRDEWYPQDWWADRLGARTLAGGAQACWDSVVS